MHGERALTCRTVRSCSPNLSPPGAPRAGCDSGRRPAGRAPRSGAPARTDPHVKAPGARPARLRVRPAVGHQGAPAQPRPSSGTQRAGRRSPPGAAPLPSHYRPLAAVPHGEGGPRGGGRRERPEEESPARPRAARGDGRAERPEGGGRGGAAPQPAGVLLQLEGAAGGEGEPGRLLCSSLSQLHAGCHRLKRFFVPNNDPQGWGFAASQSPALLQSSQH